MLTNTTGSFTVTGTGTDTFSGGNASGGQIQAITQSGTDVTTGIAVYLKNAGSHAAADGALQVTNNAILGEDLPGTFTFQYATIGGAQQKNALELTTNAGKTSTVKIDKVAIANTSPPIAGGTSSIYLRAIGTVNYEITDSRMQDATASAIVLDRTANTTSLIGKLLSNQIGVSSVADSVPDEERDLVHLRRRDRPS